MRNRAIATVLAMMVYCFLGPQRPCTADEPTQKQGQSQIPTQLQNALSNFMFKEAAQEASQNALDQLFGIESQKALNLYGEPIEVANRGNVDQALFIARLIETIHERVTKLPKGADVSQVLTRSLAELNAVQSYLESYKASTIEEGQIVSMLEVMCEGTTAMTERFLALHSELNGLDDWADSQKKEKSKALFQNTGGEYLEDATATLQSKEQLAVAVVAGVVYGGGYAWFSYEASQARNAREAAIYKELADLPEENFSRNVQLIEKCARASSVARAEWGYDVSAEERQIMQSAPTKLDRVQVIKSWHERRPRDPFAALDYCMVRGREPNLPVSQLLNLAETCLEAARNVPDADVFQRYKLLFLLSAGEFASRAASYEAFQAGEGRFRSSSEAAKFASRIWSAALKFSDDPEGYLRMREGQAIALAGDFRTGFRLLSDVSSLRDAANCPIFSYNYAAMCSVKGEAKTGLGWLTAGFERCGLGYNDWKLLQIDEDFNAIRTEFPEEFKELNPILGKWKIKDGSTTLHLFSDGSLIEKRINTGRGTFEILEGDRLRLDIEGVIYGRNISVVRYELQGDELVLTPEKSGVGVSLRYTRVR